VTLGDIVTQLNERKQRATYAAVAEHLDGRPRPRWLMKGIERCRRYSWVVARRTGWPTGYAERQIHPDCLSQIRDGSPKVIDNADELKRWLRARSG
jgi:hypothetical protein